MRRKVISRKIVCMGLALALVAPVVGNSAEAAKKGKKPEFSRTEMKLLSGGSATLKIKKNSVKIINTKWNVDNKENFGLTDRKKTSVKIVAESTGVGDVTAVVKFKAGKKTKKKKLTCHVESAHKDTAVYNTSDSCFEITSSQEIFSIVNEDRHDVEKDEAVWEQSVEKLVTVFPIENGVPEFTSELVPSSIRLASDHKTLHIAVDPGKVRKGLQYTILITGFKYADDVPIPEEDAFYYATVMQIPVAVEQGETIYEADQNRILIYFNQDVSNIIKFDKEFPEGEVTYAGQWTTNASGVAKLKDASGQEIGIKEISAYLKFEDYITITPLKKLSPGATYQLELTGFAPKGASGNTNVCRTEFTIK